MFIQFVNHLGRKLGHVTLVGDWDKTGLTGMQEGGNFFPQRAKVAQGGESTSSLEEILNLC